MHPARTVPVLVLTVVSLVAADPPSTGDPVVVRLHDGRIVRGLLAAESDEAFVVIESRLPGIEMRSAFPRARVLSVNAPTDVDLPVVVEPIDTTFAPTERPIAVPTAPAVESFDPRSVRSLFVEARVGNWDRDAEPDGLVLQVVPLDDRGRPMAVRGTVHATLDVQRFRSSRKLPWRERSMPFHEGGRWSRRVEESGFGRDGTFVRLPFRGLRPERDLAIAPDALLRVRLVVPGEGTFEAHDANVRLRPYSRFRDELEQRTGERGFQRSRSGLQRRLMDDDR